MPGDDLPLVAIIVRTKNRPQLLRRAIASILAQTFDAFLVQIVNDGGDEQPVEDVVGEFSEVARNRIKVIHNPSSVGMEAASNIGIGATTSKYLSIHDDDDTWAPSFLQRTVDHLEATGAAGVAVRTEVVFEEVGDDGIVELRREVLAADVHEVSLAQIISRGFAPPISILYQRALHGLVGLFDESLTVLGDWDFLLRVLSSTELDFIDDQPLAFWHHRPSSTGADGNSVIAAKNDHRHFETIVRDRYLRRDLEVGGGLGVLLYLTALLERQRADAAGQVDLVVQHFDSALSGTSDTTLSRELQLLNQNLISQSNRLVAQFENLEGRIENLEQVMRDSSPRARLGRYRRRVASALHKGTTS